jgi:hypothetical protein
LSVVVVQSYLGKLPEVLERTPMRLGFEDVPNPT